MKTFLPFFQKRTELSRQKTEDEFKKLHQWLKEQENNLLAYIATVENELAIKRDEHLARYSEQLSSLENLIQEMEEMHQLTVSELLQVRHW